MALGEPALPTFPHRMHMGSYSSSQICSDAWPLAKTSLGLKRGDALAWSTLGVAVGGNGGAYAQDCPTEGRSIIHTRSLPATSLGSGLATGQRSWKRARAYAASLHGSTLE